MVYLPAQVAVLSAAVVAVIYVVLTLVLVLTGRGGELNWGLHAASAAIQVVGWAFAAWLVALLVRTLRRKRR